ncbi:WYL domain-containing protein [Agromyces sp. CFH 90414]|uniref:WYL domain-containing protein n=1 Tax=Agromyces agglutinans TaxID=2662258 RepID=A0A6I2F9T2_9MICO|nr:WYL domain-containing protein [Agromyces agglutinans]MRG59470.1 WYL domain-containing protein [Agromyces agglutinans]
MRADRLVATLLLMQARGRVTAAQLADELEISVATARRDLEALSSAGVPVYPQPGRGGGWSLLGGGRTDLSGFTAAEARALFLLLGPRAGDSDDAKSALRKILRALPATFRADAEAAAEAVIVRAGGWDTAADASGGAIARTETVRTAAGRLQRAVVDRRVVRFRYTAWGREPRERVVHPLGLVDHTGTWYLLATPHEAGADAWRTYRLDRMDDLDVLDETFEAPAGFSLDDAWAEVALAVDRTRHRASAVVLVAPEAVAEVRGWIGDTELLGAAPGDVGGADAAGSAGRGDGADTADDAGEPGDRRIRLRASAPTEAVLARRLAAWADVAEVVEPASLRAALAAAGAALADRYGVPDAG